jgi:nucleotide-binding universal stress UspA family protein
MAEIDEPRDAPAAQHAPSASSRPVVLAGIDGGAGSAPVLRAAARLAEISHADVLIAHVVDNPTMTTQAPIALTESTLHSIEAGLFPDVVEALLETPVRWTLVTVTGNPATELMRLADDHAATAIVVGADTPGWTSQLRRFSTGSVPSRLAHEQRRPVVVIPEGCARSSKRSKQLTER